MRKHKGKTRIFVETSSFVSWILRAIFRPYRAGSSRVVQEQVFRLGAEILTSVTPIAPRGTAATTAGISGPPRSAQIDLESRTFTSVTPGGATFPRGRWVADRSARG
jgi:hypothetical protein